MKDRTLDLILEQLTDLSPDQRLELFGYFCVSCGDEDPNGVCTCTRDI